MAEPTCPHGFASPRSCVECMQDGPVDVPASWQKIGATFPAQFDGECHCGGPIAVGDRISRWDKGERTSYAHFGCGAPT